MALYLVQHGRSHPKTVDPEKGLTEEGRSEVQRIAEVARGYGVRVHTILHSGKTRARQTAAIMDATLSPPGGVREKTGLNPMDDVTALAGVVDSATDCMLVGHLPFMERLTAWLITGSIEPPIIKFQNGGIVCLKENPDPGGWVIAWSLMPNIG
ncbi:MAG: phosphohistidine phosphatase SixA [Desulfobacterales bacterium]|nr:phosphohistidine phosphatase SixA [Desulfobacterales bacterium]